MIAYMKIELKYLLEGLSMHRQWRHRLMVRTLDFESSNVGSIPTDA